MQKLKELLQMVSRRKVNAFDASRIKNIDEKDKYFEKGRAFAFLQVEKMIKEILKSN